MEFKNPTAADIPQLSALWSEAFGDTDEFIAGFFSTAFAPERALCAFINDELVSALYIFDCSFENEKIAYIYAVATAEKHRGRGFAKELLGYCDEYLKNNGYKAAVLVPSEDSLFKFYTNLGYEKTVFADKINICSRDMGVNVEKISGFEFAQLRSVFLPENSVLQEGASIDYLATYCSFYKGSDFLLAAYKNGDTLYGAELLGNRSVAEGIVYTLGCEQGIFKTVGSSTPYALFKPLSEIAVPCYFGLAFD